MKEIVVISGKGGTGKTSVTASLAYIGAEDLIVADCDVDAADMHLLLAPRPLVSEDFYSGEAAVIDPDLCTNCGKCAEVCRFKAISADAAAHVVDPLSCEGCGYCAHVCPSGAVTMEEQLVGQWYISETRLGSRMVHARLGIGAENSGKLVAHVKNAARKEAEGQNKDYVLVDGSPGIGCPVVSSLSGADLVILVTEPTLSAMHDLKRVHALVKRFQIPAGCIVNKADLNSSVAEELHRFLAEEHISHIADLPYDEAFTHAMVEGKTVAETIGTVAETLSASWEKILRAVEQ